MPAATPQPGVEIVEVGPRDGLQNEARTLDVDTRIQLIDRLLDQGIRRLETVSFVHPRRVPQMAGAEEVMAGLPARDDVTYIGLVLNARGAARAATTQCDEINIVVPVSDAFAIRNQGVTVEQMFDQTGASVAIGREAGRGVSVTLAVAFGCPFSGDVPPGRLAEIVDRVGDLGVDELAFADTIGVGSPRQVRELAGLVHGDPRFNRLRFHFHNTRNTGYANAAAALELRDDTGRGPLRNSVALDASAGGFGGCPFAPAATGNIATEDLLYLLRREGTPLDGPPLDIEGLADVGRWLSHHLDSPVQGLLSRAGTFEPAARSEAAS